MPSPNNRLFNKLEELKVPDGDLYGENFKVLPYQKRFLTEAIEPEILQAVLSVARGNGKTGLLSALGADFMREDGFFHKPGTECIIVAASFQQVMIGGEGVVEMLRMFYGDDFDDIYQLRSSANNFWIKHKKDNTILRAIGSDYKRAHGLRGSLYLCDEIAQWETTGGERLNAALKTSLGKRKGSRIFYFGTRARSKLHFFSRIMDMANDDPTILCHSYHADKKDDLFHRRTWDKANPSLRYGMPSLEVLKAEARQARKDESLKASFMALRCNMGVSETKDFDVLIQPDTWEETLKIRVPDREGQPVMALDLGGAFAMSSCVVCFPSGRIEQVSMMGKIPPLKERAERDGVGELYFRLHAQGELLISSDRVPRISELIHRAFERFGKPSKIVCDKHRLTEFRDILSIDSDLYKTDGVFEIPLISTGNTFKEQSQVIRTFRSCIAERKLSFVKPCDIFTMGLSEAVIISNPDGDEKLAVQTEGGRRTCARDDCIAAMLLAVGHCMEKSQGGGMAYYGAIK